MTALEEDDGERWLPVVGYEGLYEVSDHGRVRRPLDHSKPGRLISLHVKHGSGYMLAWLQTVDGIRRNCSVHKLVLEAFVGPRPAGMESFHLDDNPANNRLTNLRWDTHRANIQQSKARGSHAGIRNESAKLSEADVREIRRLVATTPLTQEQIARRFGVVRTRISDIVTGKDWTTVP